MRKLVTVLAVLAAFACAPAGAQEKVHALAMEAHADVPPPAGAPRLPSLRRSSPPHQLTRRVYGYLPYWTSNWQNLRLDLLSTLAYFASSIDEQGNITSSHGWGGEAVNALVRTAKEAGVRVAQTITLFDNAAIGRLLASADRRENAIRKIVAEVKRGEGEGVNVDFEFVPAAQKANFVTFMRDLTQRMHAEIPGSEVTIAMPAVDWSGAYDYDQLAIHTDGLMIMAYGFHWTGGPPGPLSPLVVAPPWTGRSLTWTVDDYFRYGGVENRAKFILGLPFYGNDWPTTDDRVPGTSRGTGRAVVYRTAVSNAQRYGRRWDEITKTPYYIYRASDGWHQAWYDDDESLGYKIDLINDRDLGGLGIWALTYDGTRPELFDVIAEKLTEPAGPTPDGGPPPDAGIDPDGGAGGPDAGNPDGGTLEPDAGAEAPDGGVAPPGGLHNPPDSAGGCSAAAGSSHLAMLALILALTYVVARWR
jgi:spore germination protein YaaH